MALSPPKVPPGLYRAMMHPGTIYHLGEQGPESITSEYDFAPVVLRRTKAEELLRNADWFEERNSRDARRASRQAFVLIVLVAALIAVVWLL